MCRFLVYKGSDEILLSKLILDPSHSILKQSFDSRLRLDTRRGQNNADGFGIGFYTDPKLGHAPCLFTSTIPAWNCTNLQRIASKTASRLIFAHVRATTEGSLSEDNCHPFCHESLMFMHNGGIGGWRHVKRRLSERLADRWYMGVQGGTDSEWAFALFLDTLERLGCDPSSRPAEGFGPTLLRRALLRTIEQINELTDAIPESVMHGDSVDARSLLNFAVTDGHSTICTRYISSSTDQAASLYYSSGTEWETRTSAPGDRQYQMERRDKGADIVLVASEPLTFERENWINVPTNSVLTIHKQTVMVHPIMDQFYNKNPSHVRSSAYVQTQGLATNEKLNNRFSTPAGTPLPDQEGQRRVFSSLLPHTVSRTGTPEIPPRNGKRPVSYPEVHYPAAHGVAQPTLSIQSASPKLPSQGNISRKRTSPSGPEQQQLEAPAAEDDSEQQEPPSPGMDLPSGSRAEYGNPNKIAQFFPELTLT